jgi:hypothetical protein
VASYKPFGEAEVRLSALTMDQHSHQEHNKRDVFCSRFPPCRSCYQVIYPARQAYREPIQHLACKHEVHKQPTPDTKVRMEQMGPFLRR